MEKFLLALVKICKWILLCNRQVIFCLIRICRILNLHFKTPAKIINPDGILCIPSNFYCGPILLKIQTGITDGEAHSSYTRPTLVLSFVYCMCEPNSTIVMMFWRKILFNFSFLQEVSSNWFYSSTNISTTILQRLFLSQFRFIPIVSVRHLFYVVDVGKADAHVHVF